MTLQQMSVDFVLAFRKELFDRHEINGVVTYTVKPLYDDQTDYKFIAKVTWAVHGVCLDCGKFFAKARCKSCGISFDFFNLGWHGEQHELPNQYRYAYEFMVRKGLWPTA